MKKVFLVGHGNGEIEHFIELLKDKKIETLVDVRSVPYSKFASQFNRENMIGKLTESDIKYVYMGSILGGRQPEGFDKYMNSDHFIKGIALLEKGINGSNVAIMCSEVDHAKCHRRFIGSRLVDDGFAVEDISRKDAVEKIGQKTLAGF